VPNWPARLQRGIIWGDGHGCGDWSSVGSFGGVRSLDRDRSCSGHARRRTDRLAGLLVRVPVGIALNEHTDAKGELVFRQACAMGLEGIVSKRLAAPYKSGPSRDWTKVKQ
jgi:hypothetical protein